MAFWKKESESSSWKEEWHLLAGVALVALLLTAAALYYIYTREWKPKRGTRNVLRPEGVVRRSTRSTKKPQRFEPIVNGPGGTPVRDTVLEKLTPKSGRTPRAVAEVAKSSAEAVKSAAEETPVVKRGPGRPRKTPKTEPAKEAASPPTSPMRTRRRA